MTSRMDECYEAMRREVISLRRTVDSIRKGTYITPREQSLIDENKSLKAEMRTMKQQHKMECCRLENRVDELQRYLRRYEGQTRKLEEQQSIIASLQNDIAVLKNVAEEKDKVISKLKYDNEKYLKQKNRDFTNSGKPSSQCPNSRKKIANSRPHTDRKPGGQNGHQGHCRPSLAPYDEKDAVVIDASEFENNASRYVKTGKSRVRQVVNFRFAPEVVTYISYEYVDRKTGKTVFSSFPSFCQNEYNYGPTVKALSLMLTQYCNVSIAKVSETISSITGGMVNLSKGMICNLASQFSRLTDKERNAAASALFSSPVVHNDATNMKVNGKSCFAFVTSNGKDVIYTYSSKKGFEGLDRCPLSDDQTIIHDHDKSYYSYGRHHQECLSHILRYLLEGQELDPRFCWEGRMRELLQNMIHDRKQRPDRKFTAAEIARYRDRYDEILKLAEAEYADETISGSQEGKNLFSRCREEKDQFLLFLERPDIDHCNNLAERLLRSVKRKMKQIISLRSTEGAINLLNALSIINTCKLKNIPVYDKLVSVFATGNN